MSKIPAWAVRLRAEREERGWSRLKMAQRLVEAADDGDRMRMPTLESLVRMIRSWERGDHRPSGIYAALYRRAFGRADILDGDGGEGEAGGGAAATVLDPEMEERMLFAARRPSRIDRPVVDSLAAVLAGQRRVEDAIGSEPLVAPVRAQLDMLDGMLVDVAGRVRPPLLDVASQWAQFAGWLHASTGRHGEAGLWYERALLWASEAGNVDMVATALNMKGHLAWLAGKPGPMLGLSQAAQRERGSSDGVLALAVQQEARALAIVGEADGVDRKLDQAVELTLSAAARPDDQPPWIYFFNTGMLSMQRALAYRYLGRHEAAAELLREGLSRVAPDLRHSEWVGSYVVDLALTYAAMGAVSDAVASAREAVAVASKTGSERIWSRVRGLRQRLAREWAGSPAVAELDEVIRAAADAGRADDEAPPASR